MSGGAETNIINSLLNVQSNIVNSLLNVQSNAVTNDNVNTKILLDAINSLQIKDLREKIVERGYLKVGIATNWTFPGFADFTNPNNPEGYLIDISKMHALALFGEDTIRIVDTEGKVIQHGKLQFVHTTTPTRFQQLNDDEFDILMHAVTGTVDRLINQKTKLVAPYQIVNTLSVVDSSYNIESKSYDQIVQEIIDKNGKCRLGTSDNCTALIFSNQFKQLWSDPSQIEIVITENFIYGIGTDYDIYTTDGWVMKWISSVDPSVKTMPPIDDPLLQFADKYYIGYRHNELNNDMGRISQIILNILFRAIKLGITRENALTFDVTDDLASEALLLGTYSGGDSIYSDLHMPNSDFGRVLLSKFGNLEQITSNANELLGEDALPKAFPGGDYGTNVFVTNAGV